MVLSSAVLMNPKQSSWDIWIYKHMEEWKGTTKSVGIFSVAMMDIFLMAEIDINSNEQLSRLTLRPLGKTSRASSITYLHDDIVFIGSRYADSQLMKMHQLHETSLNTNIQALQVLKTYSNSGPVIDFSLSNKPAGLRKLVMCCGTRDDSSLGVVIPGVGINEKFFLNVPGIKRIWA